MKQRYRKRGNSSGGVETRQAEKVQNFGKILHYLGVSYIFRVLPVPGQRIFVQTSRMRRVERLTAGLIFEIPNANKPNRVWTRGSRGIINDKKSGVPFPRFKLKSRMPARLPTDSRITGHL